MNRGNVRFFWLKQKGEAVEISYEKWRKLTDYDPLHDNFHTTARVHKNEVYFRRGTNGLFVPKKQLITLLMPEIAKVPHGISGR